MISRDEPIKGDLILYIDTDNQFDFPIVDANYARVDVTGWLADFQIDVDEDTWESKLLIPASVEIDPDDATKTILRVLVADSDIQADDWEERKYPYSLKRTNSGAEKELRYGKVELRRVR